MIFDRIVGRRGLTRRIHASPRTGRSRSSRPTSRKTSLQAPWWKRVRTARIPRADVPTSDLVIGHSRIGRARIGTGHPLEEIRGTKTHTKDGLIRATAFA